MNFEWVWMWNWYNCIWGRQVQSLLSPCVIYFQSNKQGMLQEWDINTKHKHTQTNKHPSQQPPDQSQGFFLLFWSPNNLAFRVVWWWQGVVKKASIVAPSQADAWVSYWDGLPGRKRTIMEISRGLQSFGQWQRFLYLVSNHRSLYKSTTWIWTSLSSTQTITPHPYWLPAGTSIFLATLWHFWTNHPPGSVLEPRAGPGLDRVPKA